MFFVPFVVKHRLKSCFPIFDAQANAIDFMESFDRQGIGQMQSGAAPEAQPTKPN